ncbi:MAG: hypothetical protein ACOY94_16115 [Bacillota bacterium]
MEDRPNPDKLNATLSDQEGATMKKLLELLARFMALRGFHIP